MNISTAIEIAESLSPRCAKGKKISKYQWACRVLAGAYRRQKMVHEKFKEQVGDIRVAQKYQFLSKMFEKPYAPHYDAYRGHKFIIDHVHPEAADHIFLICVTDPSVKVQGYVEIEDLEKAS